MSTVPAAEPQRSGQPAPPFRGKKHNFLRRRSSIDATALPRPIVTEGGTRLFISPPSDVTPPTTPLVASTPRDKPNPAADGRLTSATTTTSPALRSLAPTGSRSPARDIFLEGGSLQSAASPPREVAATSTATAATDEDPFEANRKVYEMIHQVSRDCIDRRMLLVLRDELPLVHLHPAAVIVRDFFRQQILKRKTIQPLWRLFEFWTRRIIRSRRKLRAVCLAWIERRRSEIEKCLSRWTARERKAQTELPFLEYIAMWVPPANKRAVIVDYRRDCCHQWLLQCKKYLEIRREQETQFFEVARATRSITLRAYRVVKSFILHLSASRKSGQEFLFYKVNIYSLIAVLARNCYPDRQNSDVEETVSHWISDRRIQRPGDLPREPFTECALLRKVSQEPLFPEKSSMFVARKSKMANFLITASVLSSLHLSKALRQRALAEKLHEAAQREKNKSRSVFVLDGDEKPERFPSKPRSTAASRRSRHSSSRGTTRTGSSDRSDESFSDGSSSSGDSLGGARHPKHPRSPQSPPRLRVRGAASHAMALVGDLWLEDDQWQGTMVGSTAAPVPSAAEQRRVRRSIGRKSLRSGSVTDAQIKSRGFAVLSQADTEQSRRRQGRSSFRRLTVVFNVANLSASDVISQSVATAAAAAVSAESTIDGLHEGGKPEVPSTAPRGASPPLEEGRATSPVKKRLPIPSRGASAGRRRNTSAVVSATTTGVKKVDVDGDTSPSVRREGAREPEPPLPPHPPPPLVPLSREQLQQRAAAEHPSLVEGGLGIQTARLHHRPHAHLLPDSDDDDDNSYLSFSDEGRRSPSASERRFHQRCSADTPHIMSAASATAHNDSRRSRQQSPSGTRVNRSLQRHHQRMNSRNHRRGSRAMLLRLHTLADRFESNNPTWVQAQHDAHRYQGSYGEVDADVGATTASGGSPRKVGTGGSGGVATIQPTIRPQRLRLMDSLGSPPRGRVAPGT